LNLIRQLQDVALKTEMTLSLEKCFVQLCARYVTGESVRFKHFSLNSVLKGNNANFMLSIVEHEFFQICNRIVNKCVEILCRKQWKQNLQTKNSEISLPTHLLKQQLLFYIKVLLQNILGSEAL